MPELPEVEIVRRGLDQALLGHTITNAQVNRFDLRIPIPQNFSNVLEGDVVQKTTRRGKYILIFFESGDAVVWHLGMSGRVHIYKSGDDSYVRQKHDHVLIETADGTKIIFNDPRRFGMLYLAKTESWERQEPFASMGPEPLGNNFSGPALKDALARRSGAVKTALLDQKLVAGIGNIYACEALYEAGIHPQRSASAVRGGEAETLAACLRSVLQKAIAAGGSSLKDYQKTDGSLGYFQYRFSVYDREHQPCPECSCADGVRRIVQAGRSTFYCEGKQR